MERKWNLSKIKFGRAAKCRPPKAAKCRAAKRRPPNAAKRRAAKCHQTFYCHVTTFLLEKTLKGIQQQRRGYQDWEKGQTRSKT